MTPGPRAPPRSTRRGPWLAAGLVAFRHDAALDEWTTTFTVITGTGEDAAGEMHDRMPGLSGPCRVGHLVGPAKLDKDDAANVLDLLDAESRAVASTLQTRPVSRAGNNVRTLGRRDAGLIEPIVHGGVAR